MLPYSHVIIMIVVEWTVVVSHGLQNVLYYSSLLYCYFAVHHCFCLFVFSFSLVHFQFMMSFKDFLIKILYLVSCILYHVNEPLREKPNVVVSDKVRHKPV